MEKATQMTDPVFDKVNETTRRDNELAEKIVVDLVQVLKESFGNEEESFELKHGFLALGKAILYLSQAYCKDSEHFNQELDKAHNLAVEKMMRSVMPLVQDGKVVDENFDMEDLSIRRILMALACAIDYTFWRNEVSAYATKRLKLEEESSQEV